MACQSWRHPASSTSHREKSRKGERVNIPERLGHLSVSRGVLLAEQTAQDCCLPLQHLPPLWVKVFFMPEAIEMELVGEQLL